MGLEVTANAAAGKDASVSVPAALTLLAAGSVKHAGHLYVQNQSNVTLQLILNYGGGSPTTILLAAGQGVNAQGADWQAWVNAPWFVGAFAVCGPAGSQVAVIFN